MTTITIMEGLAEIKTIGKRLANKRRFVMEYIFHEERIKDPLENQGGSEKLLTEELQAIGDLEGRIVAIRMAINAANQRTSIEIGGQSKTISEWLIWKRDVAPGLVKFYNDMVNTINNARRTAARRGVASADAGNPESIVVNVSETKLKERIEALSTIIGTLDGQLALQNATTTIEV